jgi:hypothetical protein
LATGLGSLNVGNLLTNWSSASFTADTVAITSPATNTVNITHGSTANFTVKVTPTTATGAVSLVASPPGKAQVGIGSFSQSNATFTLSGGTATIATNQLPGGTSYPVVASYSGDGTFAAGTSPSVLVTVTPEASNTAVNVVTFNAQNNPIINTGNVSLQYGSSYILQIAVSDSAKQQCAKVVVACPTGTVTLKDGTSPVNDFNGQSTVALNSQGIAEDQPVQLGVAVHNLTAAYSGDNSFTASTSPPVALTVTPATTTTTATSSAATVPIGQSVTLTASIATQSSGAAPTGTVSFMVGGKSVGSGTVTGTAGNSTAASATATVSFSSAGAQSITAVYSGDTNYAGSTSAAIAITATTGTQATTTVVTPSATSIASGGSVTFTAKVTGTANNGPGLTGAVQFMNGTTALGTAATCTPTAGTASTPGTCTAMLTTTLAFLAPPTSPRNGSRRPPFGPFVPAGPISIFASLLLAALLLRLGRLRAAPLPRKLAYTCAGGLLLACLAAGITGCGGGGSTTTPPPPPTPHTDSITAVYSGDGTYAASTSAAVTISVQ